MNADLDAIKTKILALASKTTDNGCTEAEAMSAMAMVGRLLQSYNLTMDECDVRKSKCRTIHIALDSQRRSAINDVVVNLTALFNGKCWFSKTYKDGKRVVSYAFFVQEQDIEALQYLFHVINTAIESESQAYKRTDEYKHVEGAKKSATVSFQRGMATRISSRLNDIRKENEAAMQAAKSTGTALIVLKGKLIEEEFAKEGIKLRTTYTTRRVRNYGAYQAGQAAGDRVNLNRPLNSGANTAGYLS